VFKKRGSPDLKLRPSLYTLIISKFGTLYLFVIHTLYFALSKFYRISYDIPLYSNHCEIWVSFEIDHSRKFFFVKKEFLNTFCHEVAMKNQTPFTEIFFRFFDSIRGMMLCKIF